MKVYVINEMTGFRAVIDTEGITIEKNNNLHLGVNTKYIALLIKLTSEYSNMSKLYKELCYRLEFDYASVWRDF